MKLAPLWLLPLLLVGPSAQAAPKPRIEVQEHTLANGMRWLLVERRDAPTIAAGWVAHVGSVNERPGITGLSHFFEHMMFKGTHVLGTKNIATDLRLIAEQEKLRQAMRAEMSLLRERLRRGEIDDLAKPENRSPRYRELEATAAHRGDAPGQVRRGVQRPLLAGPSLPVAGGGLGFGHPRLHQGASRRLLRHLLRAQQPDRHPGGRLQERRDPASAQPLLRPHPAGQEEPT